MFHKEPIIVKIWYPPESLNQSLEEVMSKYYLLQQLLNLLYHTSNDRLAESLVSLALDNDHY